MTLTDKQWEQVTKRIRVEADNFIKYHHPSDLAKGEIHEQGGDGYEQREYLGNYYTLESHLRDIIEEIGAVEDARMVDGFHETIIETMEWMSDRIEGSWHVYTDDGDLWVARHWNERDDIPEEVQHLVQEY